MWGDRLISPPQSQAVDLATVKQYLRITDDESDTELSRLIEAATDRCQNLCRRQFITAAREITLACFPKNSVIYLPWSPLIDVLSVTYYDTADALQLLDPDTYEVDNKSEPGRIHLGYSQSWPATRWRMQNVSIEYLCGYGETPECVPKAVQQALILAVQHMFDFRSELARGPGVSMVPGTTQDLLTQYTVGDEFIRYDPN